MIGPWIVPAASAALSFFGNRKSASGSPAPYAEAANLGADMLKNFQGENLEKGASAPPLDYAASGEGYSTFMDKAYPGTTTWERLGANSPMGSMVSADQTGKSERYMQDKELKTRKEINDQTNLKDLIIGGSQFGMKGIQAMVDMFKKGSTGGQDFETHLSQAAPNIKADTKEKIANRIKLLQEARKTGSEAKYEAERAKLAKELAAANLNSEEYKSVSAAIAQILKKSYGVGNQIRKDAGSVYKATRKKTSTGAI